MRAARRSRFPWTSDQEPDHSDPAEDPTAGWVWSRVTLPGGLVMERRGDCLLVFEQGPGEERLPEFARSLPRQPRVLTVLAAGLSAAALGRLTWSLEAAVAGPGDAENEYDEVRLIEVSSVRDPGREAVLGELATRLGIPVLVSVGEMLQVPGGTLFPITGTGAGTWHSYRPGGGAPESLGPWHLGVDWRLELAQVPREGHRGMSVLAVPAGLALLPSPGPRPSVDDVLYCIPVDESAPLIIVNLPDDPATAGLVGSFLKALPPALLSRIRLGPSGFPVDPPTAPGWAQAVADSLRIPITSLTGTPLMIEDEVRVSVLRPVGPGTVAVAWRPLATALTYQPRSGSRVPPPIVAQWRPAIADVAETAPRVYRLDDVWAVEILAGGLWLYRIGSADVPMVREMAFDPDAGPILVVGCPAESIPQEAWEHVGWLLDRIAELTGARALVRVLATSTVLRPAAAGPEVWSGMPQGGSHGGPTALERPAEQAAPVPVAPSAFVPGPAQDVSSPASQGPSGAVRGEQVLMSGRIEPEPAPAVGGPTPDALGREEPAATWLDVAALADVVREEAAARAAAWPGRVRLEAERGGGDGAQPVRDGARDTGRDETPGPDVVSTDSTWTDPTWNDPAGTDESWWAGTSWAGGTRTEGAGPDPAGEPAGEDRPDRVGTGVTQGSNGVSPAAIITERSFPETRSLPRGPSPSPDDVLHPFPSIGTHEPEQDVSAAGSPLIAVAERGSAEASDPDGGGRPDNEPEKTAVERLPGESAILASIRPESDQTQRAAFRSEAGAWYSSHLAAVNALLARVPSLRTADPEATKADLLAVRAYLSGFASPIDRVATNAALRGAGDPAALRHAACLVSGLRRLPRYQGMARFGTDLEDAWIAAYEPGTRLTEWAIVEAVASPSRPVEGNVEFVIWSSTGRRVGGLADVPPSDEVLFLPGTAFVVLGRLPGPDGVTRILLRDTQDGVRAGTDADAAAEVSDRRDSIAKDRLEKGLARTGEDPSPIPVGERFRFPIGLRAPVVP